MTTQNVQSARPHTRRPWIMAAVASLVLLGVIMATLPPMRRMLANPAGGPIIKTGTAIAVTGDTFQGHVFAPAVLQVAMGSTVTWTFADRGAAGNEPLVEHNVVGPAFASPILSEGSWSFSFDTPGSYDYVCTLHPFMNGRIEVVAQ